VSQKALLAHSGPLTNPRGGGEGGGGGSDPQVQTYSARLADRGSSGRRFEGLEEGMSSGPATCPIHRPNAHCSQACCGRRLCLHACRCFIQCQTTRGSYDNTTCPSTVTTPCAHLVYGCCTTGGVWVGCCAPSCVVDDAAGVFVLFSGTWCAGRVMPFCLPFRQLIITHVRT
jgi:hypothetical protein